MLSVSGPVSWNAFLVFWAAIGLTYSAILTPSGRLLKRSADADDRPALFAAQFALSHLCWLLSYLVAGWAGATMGLGPSQMVLGAIACLGLVTAWATWPPRDDMIAHEHPDLPANHPHLTAHASAPHKHVKMVDDLHRSWPN